MARARSGMYYGGVQTTRRPAVMGLRGAVSSGHYLASQAGMRILQRGGNAIDAGVAAGLCLNVLLPYLTSLGGVAPIILYSAREKRVTTISGLGRWPQSASIGEMKERGKGEIPRGILRCVTPAALDAWVMSLARYGRLGFGEVAEPALELAERGFPVDQSLHSALSMAQPELAQWPSTMAAFFPGGRPLGVGQVLVQKDLARTLKTLIEAESSSGAWPRQARLEAVRDAFYRGEIARGMAEFSRSQGGFLTAGDLADFRVREEPPISVDYKGYRVYACGPWCQGPAVPQALKMLEGIGLVHMGHNSAAYLHHLVEALKLTFADRERYYGDPDFVSVPVDALLSDGYARHRRDLIDRRKAWPEMPPHGDPHSLATAVAAAGLPFHRPTDGQPQGDTSYVCAMDAEGNAYSATPSDFIGDGPIVPGLGFVISGRGAQSWLDPEHPSSLQPGKRPRLTPNPGLVMREGEPWMAFGTPGGDQQPQSMVQVFLNIVEFGMSPQEAVEAPRVGSESFPNSFWPHAYLPGWLNVEERIPSRTRRALHRLGHDVHLWNGLEPRAGLVCAVLLDRSTGVLSGAADPRSLAHAVAW